MERHPNDLTTDEEIDEALEQAKQAGSFPHVVEASYRSDPGWECLALRWNDGHRMLIPKETLGELKDATAAQASDVEILPSGLHLWWPQWTTAYTCRTFWSIGGARNCTAWRLRNQSE